MPHHRTDLILRKVNLDRYDDRDLVRTNLIESYEHILAFVEKHLPDPFYLEGTDRISFRDAIFREVASNILIHREYTNAFPAKLIIERGQVRTENSNKPHGFGTLDPATFTPFPKNPVIGAFFREIHRADELGSGLHKMMRYGKAYGGADPEMIEGDVFRIVVKVPEFGLAADDQFTPPVTPPVEAQVELPKWQIDLLSSCASGEKTGKELLIAAGYQSRTGNFKKGFQRLVEEHFIEMTLPEKPNSRLQKYRLTDKGRAWLEENHE